MVGDLDGGEVLVAVVARVAHNRELWSVAVVPARDHVAQERARDIAAVAGLGLGKAGEVAVKAVAID